jgi:hypothetical protein
MSFDINDLTRLFRTKLRVCDECECWIFTGAWDSDGYGSFHLRGRNLIAHRYAFERLVGEIEPEMTLDHLRCSLHACCNPAHLQPVSRTENSARGNETRYRGTKTDADGQQVVHVECTTCTTYYNQRKAKQ